MTRKDKPIKRYWVGLDGFDGLKEVESKDGEYVKYEDHCNVIAAQRAEIERLTALATQYHDTAENQKNDIEQLQADLDQAVHCYQLVVTAKKTLDAKLVQWIDRQKEVL